MAGIYIPDAETPKRCYDCPACHGAECWANNGAYISDYRKPRPEWCPIVSIPDHGRLIDEVRLTMQIETAKEIQKNEQRDFCNAFINNGELCTEWWCVEDMIENAPTIIPADKERITEK